MCDRNLWTHSTPQHCEPSLTEPAGSRKRGKSAKGIIRILKDMLSMVLWRGELKCSTLEWPPTHSLWGFQHSRTLLEGRRCISVAFDRSALIGQRYSAAALTLVRMPAKGKYSLDKQELKQEALYRKFSGISQYQPFVLLLGLSIITCATLLVLFFSLKLVRCHIPVRCTLLHTVRCPPAWVHAVEWDT